MQADPHLMERPTGEAMTETAYSTQAAAAQPGIVQSLPALRVSYANAALDGLFDDDVLAVIGFGSAAPAAHADARYLRVALEAHGSVPFEVWRGSGRVRRSKRGVLQIAADSDYEFGMLELEESEYGGLAATSALAYTQLSQHLAASAMPYPLRIWNYLDAINLGAGDDERYRQFCSGRAAGMRGGFATGYPAATAIGVRDGRRVLQVYWLAARLPGTPVENPRQLNAWRYPRQYGPDAPNFARAMRAPAQSAQVYISGTAAIVGHISRHIDDFAGQVRETLANLDSVLSAAAVGDAERFGPHAMLKVYVRRDADLKVARDLLAASPIAHSPILLLGGDICRSELLIEIDGIQGANETVEA
jgi:chorismate lyase/3-hydroxybenzoate synthase